MEPVIIVSRVGGLDAMTIKGSGFRAAGQGELIYRERSQGRSESSSNWNTTEDGSKKAWRKSR